VWVCVWVGVLVMRRVLCGGVGPCLTPASYQGLCIMQVTAGESRLHCVMRMLHIHVHAGMNHWFTLTC
jgi:hypothetical protein